MCMCMCVCIMHVSIYLSIYLSIYEPYLLFLSLIYVVSFCPENNDRVNCNKKQLKLKKKKMKENTR